MNTVSYLEFVLTDVIILKVVYQWNINFALTNNRLSVNIVLTFRSI